MGERLVWFLPSLTGGSPLRVFAFLVFSGFFWVFFKWAPCFPSFIPYSTAETRLLILNLNINLMILVLPWSTCLSHHLTTKAREFLISQLPVWTRQCYITRLNLQHRNNFSADLASQLTSALLPEPPSSTEMSLQKSDGWRLFTYYIITVFFFKSFVLTLVYCEMESANWLVF